MKQNLTLRLKKAGSLLLLGLLLIFSSASYAQTGCDCPAIDSCVPCNEGITSLTFRYDGLIAATITVTDGQGKTLFGPALVAVGGEFTVSDGGSNVFGGGKITLSGTDDLLNALTPVDVNTTCTDPPHVGRLYSTFMVMAGSTIGGEICCLEEDLDKNAPVISNCPTDITVYTGSATCPIQVSWTAPTASDNCGSPVSLVSDHEPDGYFPVGTTLVTYTATDEHGNSATCPFNVIVIDDGSPAFTICPVNISVSTDEGSCDAVVTWDIPTATDNCGTPSVTRTLGLSPGSSFAVGAHTVEYKASDGTNEVFCSFTITVEDLVKPVFDNCPADMAVSTSQTTCDAVVEWAELTATDNCGTATVTQTAGPAPGSTLGIGTYIIEYTATDGVNEEICSFTITVEDQVKPVFNCRSDIVVSTDPDVCSAVVNWTIPSASDNCGGVTVTSSDPMPGSTFQVGSRLITYTAEDSYGNTSTCSFNIIVEDNELPEFNGCPTDIIVSADEGSCGTSVSWTAPTASDNCGIQSVTPPPADSGPGATFEVGLHTITYTALDLNGNTGNCSFNIQVLDNEKPVFTNCPTSFTVSTDPNACDAVVNWDIPTATDNCSVTVSPAMGDPAPGATLALGTHTITYTASDGTNTETCSFTITVEDNESPVLTACPADIIVNTDPGSCDAVVNWSVPTSSDNCGNASVSSSGPAPGSAFNVGIHTILYTAEDDYGNTSTCSFNIEVVDNEKPEFTSCPADIIIDAAPGACGAVVSWNVPTAMDNCTATVSTSDAGPGSTFTVGTHTITYTASDGRNADTCSFTITVIDNEKPVLADTPANITASTDPGLCTAVVNWLEPTATDNCGTVSISRAGPSSGTTLNVGMHTVTYTATDGKNEEVYSFTITVEDQELPVFAGCPADIIAASADGSCDKSVTWKAPTVSDNCGSPVMVASHTSSTVFALGTHTVTYTATDNYGNKSICSFNVTVVDKKKPIFTFCPIDIIVSADPNSCETNVTWSNPTASDNCGVVSLSSSDPASGSKFSVGAHTISYTAADAAGNTSTCSFNIQVVDNEKPVFTSCPENIIASTDPGSCETVVNWNVPEASDNCGSPLITAPVTVPGSSFSIGTHTLEYIASDGVNSETCSFTITVQDNELPVFTNCPADMAIKATSCLTPVSWEEPVAADNCAFSLIQSHQPGDEFPVGITTVTYTATDADGNETICSFNITLENHELQPVISCLTDISIDASSQCGSTATWTAPAVSHCSEVALTSTHAPGDFFSIGNTEVIYTATDELGNSSQCSFMVTVTDNVAPVFSSCQGNIEVIAGASCDAAVTWDELVATDNCAIESTSATLRPGDVFPLGVTEVMYKATDVHGNQSTCVFLVTVNDQKTPVFSDCPVDMIIKTDESGQAEVYWAPPTATASCTEVTLSSTHEPGQIFSLGRTEVIYTATTTTGFSSQCSFVIDVSLEDIVFDVAKLITPDGDGMNDFWKLANIEKFLNNQVTIFDRWGSIIFSGTGYNNESVVWEGANQNGGSLPTGTYFYVISVHFGGEDVKQSGSIELIR